MRTQHLFLALALNASLLSAADAKPKPSDYPAHFQADGVEYGAEYLVRSVSHRGSMIVVDSYLVVELAVYPPKGRQVTISSQPFALRLNGKKELLFAQTPGIVAASVKYPDWEQRPGAEASASAGNAGVILGRPPGVERFPGDNRPASRRVPNPVPPVSTQPEAAAKPEQIAPEDRILESSLPEGQYRTPVAGNLYFAWKGKPEKIKTVELIMTTSAGNSVTTRLR